MQKGICKLEVNTIKSLQSANVIHHKKKMHNSFRSLQLHQHKRVLGSEPKNLLSDDKAQMSVQCQDSARLILMYRSIPKLPIPPPPGQTPGHLTFLKNFGQIPCYVAVFTVKCPTRSSFKEGQTPHPVMPCTHEINKYKQN